MSTDSLTGVALLSLLAVLPSARAGGHDEQEDANVLRVPQQYPTIQGRWTRRATATGSSFPAVVSAGPRSPGVWR